MASTFFSLCLLTRLCWHLFSLLGFFIRSLQGDGAFTVNGKTLAAYFARTSDRRHALEPLLATQVRRLLFCLNLPAALTAAC